MNVVVGANSTTVFLKTLSSHHTRGYHRSRADPQGLAKESADELSCMASRWGALVALVAFTSSVIHTSNHPLRVQP